MKLLTPEEKKAAREAFIIRTTERSELVEFGGFQLEVRQPNLATKGEIYRSAQLEFEDEEEAPKRKGKRVSFDMVKMQLIAVIRCTFYPGTKDRVFNDLDLPMLSDQLAGGGVEKLGEAAMRMLNVKMADVEKKSEATQTSDSSSSFQPS